MGNYGGLARKFIDIYFTKVYLPCVISDVTKNFAQICLLELDFVSQIQVLHGDGLCQRERTRLARYRHNTKVRYHISRVFVGTNT